MGDSTNNIETMLTQDKLRKMANFLDVITNKRLDLVIERQRLITYGGDLFKAAACQTQIELLTWLLEKANA